MSDCLFCKIIAGDIPNYTVYQDENVLAFLDIFPCSKGHTVVIPKKHFNSLVEVSAQDWAKIMSGLKSTFDVLDNKLKPAGWNIGINERAAAGQAVPHLHWHLIPRYENDGGGSMHSIIKTKEKIDVAELAKLFK